jgi:electron-transferring-flavoprotein dehydrogenase
VVEKGSEVGAHIVSGAVFEPRALNELFPNWKELDAPLNTPVTEDEVFLFKSDTKAKQLPNFAIPNTLNNHGNYIISLGNLCRWLAQQAENLGVEILPGFAATEVLYDENGAVKGIATGDMGIDKNGDQKGTYQAGYELHAKYTLFSEGCRGQLGKELIEKFGLAENTGTQHYGLGIKEIWEIDPAVHSEGKVIHSMGWPLSETKTGGGGFLYHIEDNQVALGLITDLNYKNPYLSPFEEMQRWKHHPEIAKYLKGGTRISYGARAINKGGLQAIPKLHFPGGVFSGCEAGFMNVAKIKGSHTAMKTGMLASESIFDALKAGTANTDLSEYAQHFRNSWVFDELYSARNVGPFLHKYGNTIGGALTFLDQSIFKGKMPFTLQDSEPDYKLALAKDCKEIQYPKPDGVISFDRLSSVFVSNTMHEEDQPCHLKLSNTDTPIKENLPKYAEPAQRYCPAGVYEVVKGDDGESKFVINGQNCVHCKTCDIKDPAQNITWTAPEGAGGPNYPNM